MKELKNIEELLREISTKLDAINPPAEGPRLLTETVPTAPTNQCPVCKETFAERSSNYNCFNSECPLTTRSVS